MYASPAFRTSSLRAFRASLLASLIRTYRQEGAAALRIARQADPVIPRGVLLTTAATCYTTAARCRRILAARAAVRRAAILDTMTVLDGTPD